MESIAKEFEKVIKRQRTLKNESHTTIDALVQRLTDAKALVASTAQQPHQQQSQLVYKHLQALSKPVKDLSTKLTEAHKDMQSVMYKYSKVVEKRFKTDLDSIWDPKAFQEKEDIIYQALAIHFVREGRFDMAQVFADEAGSVQIPSHLKSLFFEMFQIQEALRSKDITPAIQWATKRRPDLEKQGSLLEFQLHKLRFIQLLVSIEPHAALAYAKANFPMFPRHLKEIQQLMCSILFVNKLSLSPYASLLNPHLWTDIQTTFTRDFCMLIGLSSDSPLFIAVTAGTTALPTIIKMSSIMKDKTGLEWSQQGELPVEIPLVDAYRFHSVFTCPVSKEPGSEENPPMMMLCGHTVCKETLMRLSKSNTNVKFKCPYCPSESTVSQAIRVYF
ncbi:hypothetical protein BATDEDRAFT_89624 [Batrachochytrium dendrobatidis JAM81]|uniref:GID complex catalytic subunit 2 n=2 Tax=Batrachochytrium dendrobatidis TaxID=109871 RepID=F4P665_BATDJ|nr:ubiquitin-protein ligase RMD5 [Batrachochytrium dendrobatidis JAM81]EGF79550.1 hypothetical protein BATDEDRAFT_89624 [Batrachochytrium dendrobatidis JAM81]KAJ8322963.1 hypothetical protein O5D80_008480 [Batrachochytrium dendrobatidis]KAK5665716.1 hypothetical protein QVD99_007358 [Batrachochytrium dendrobatidis]OAJ42654.1 hypothetical protein BDEG_26081 [Batrachochytrium dendrobatidis JEL423]|eukprot:XP_006680199.1 hypothetical protein BATDEDRAFT_89624 [Batrachochytrium dendrobatidis JAM81]